MTLTDMTGLFVAMLAIAIIPGPNALALVARTFSSGLLRGLYMIIGFLVADYVFMLLALFGLAALAEAIGPGFVLIKFASAAYLIYLGVRLMGSRSDALDVRGSKDSSLTSNAVAGFLLTFSNPKAIVFYLAIFPAFVDVGSVTMLDILILFAISTVAFGSVNLAYAMLAFRVRKLFASPEAVSTLQKTSGGIMISTGLLVALKS